MNGSRLRSIGGWAVGWSVAAAALWTAPLLTRLGEGDLGGICAVAGGAAGIGLGAYLAASARAGTTAQSGAPIAEAIAWALAFGVACLFVVLPPREEFAKPGEVNAVTWPARGGTSSSGRRVQLSPVQIRFFESLPLLGGVGGFFAAVAGSRRASRRRALRGLLPSVVWALAVVVAAIVAVQSGYLLVGGLPRALSPLSPVVGLVVGALISGALAGAIAGAIGEPLRRPTSA